MFKEFKICVSLFLTFIVIFLNGIIVMAMDSGLSTENMEQTKIDNFISNINLISFYTEPQKKSIQCFDVNKDGIIAIGQENEGLKEVCIYLSDGSFQYGYRFNCNQSFYIEWIDENINIYFVRSDVVVTVTTTGQIIDVAKVLNSVENNSYINHVLASTNRTVGNLNYVIKNDIGIMNYFASSYSQLTMVNSDGEEFILYDVNSSQLVKYYTTVAIVILVIVCVIIYLYVNLKKGVWTKRGYFD